MIWPDWLQEKARQFIVAATRGPWAQMQDQAIRLEEEIRQVELAPKTERARRMPWQKKPRSGVDKSGLAFPAVAPGKSQADRRDERNDRIAADRRAAMERNRRMFGGRCEWCFTGEAVHAHHVLGGADRRIHESPYTLAPVCGGPGDPDSCHGRTEEPVKGVGGPAWDLEQSMKWARRLAADPRCTQEERAGFARTAQMLEQSQALLDAKRLTTREG